MDWLRGLFGSSARNMKEGGTFAARADPTLDDPISRTLGNDTMRRPPVMDPQADRAQGADRMALFGATMQDVGANLRGGQGDALSRVQAGFRARSDREKSEAELARLREMAQGLYGDDQEAMALFELAPEKFIEQQLEARKPKKPQVLNTREGVFLFDEDAGALRPLREFEDAAPSGYRWVDGKLAFIPGGPADPATVGQLGGVRREAVVSRPMPRRGGGGSGGRAAPKPPAGFILD